MGLHLVQLLRLGSPFLQVDEAVCKIIGQIIPTVDGVETISGNQKVSRSCAMAVYSGNKPVPAQSAMNIEAEDPKLLRELNKKMGPEAEEKVEGELLKVQIPGAGRLPIVP